ncbi:cation:proton antiporter [soil metagenome]
MTAFAILLFSAAVGLALARLTNIPSVPLLIVLGVLVGLGLPVEAEILQDVLILGVAVLVFTAGIELNPGRIRPHGRLAVQVGLTQFLLLGVLGVGLGHLLGMGTEGALYLGLALTASSTLVVVRILQRRQQLFEPLGRLLTGVLLLQDLLIILAIPVVTRLPEGAGSVAAGVAGTIAMLGVALAILRWVAPAAVRRLSVDEETLMLVVLSTLFIFLGGAHALGLPLVTGAFLAGLALSGFPVHVLVRGQLNSITDFFHALFFTALGAFLPFPSPQELMQALLLAAGVVVLTPPLVALICERAGLSARPSVSAGLLLAQTSEFSLVVALLGVSTGQLSPGLLTVITLVTVLTMAVTPLLATDRVNWAIMRLHPSRRRRRTEDPPTDHILLLGAGRNGLTLLEMLVITPNRVVVVDDDPALIGRLSLQGIEAIRGDVSDTSVLQAAGAAEARVVISTIRRVGDNRPVLEMVRESEREVLVLVRTFDHNEADLVRSLGGHPVLYSEAAASEFMAWLDRGAAPDLDEDPI